MTIGRRVLSLSRDRGSVQAILPVLQRLDSDPAYQLTVISLETTLSLFEHYGITSQPFDEAAFALDAEGYVCQLLRQYHPMLVLSGSSPAKSIPPETPEQFITWMARRHAIKVLAVQDFWGMYKERFFDAEGRLDNRLIPDCLCVLDNQSREQLKKLGLKQRHMAITHNPWMDQVVSESRNLPQASALLASSGLNILFVSQPLHETKDFHARPYDQEDILSGILAAIPPAQLDGSKHHILIWSHPGEKSDRWQDIGKWQRSGLDISITDERGAAILAYVDLVVTSHSTVVYEALYYGTPCVSFRPGAEAVGPLITDSLGLSKSFTDEADFKQYLQNTDLETERTRLLQQKQEMIEQRIFFSNGKATARVLKEIACLLGV